ncbi:conserved hypothetical protein [uncultured Thiomicrorhabdus sp.]
MASFTHQNENENLQALSHYEQQAAEFLIGSKQFKDLLKFYYEGSPGELIERKFSKINNWPALLSEVLLSKITYFELTLNYELSLLQNLQAIFEDLLLERDGDSVLDVLYDKKYKHAEIWYKSLIELIETKQS